MLSPEVHAGWQGLYCTFSYHNTIPSFSKVEDRKQVAGGILNYVGQLQQELSSSQGVMALSEASHFRS